MENQNLDDLIRKYAVKNAFEYGKADLGSVIKKVIAKNPDSKRDMKYLAKTAGIIVGEINDMPHHEIEQIYQSYKAEFEHEDEEKIIETSKPKFVLDGAVKGKFASRYAPAPSGYLHIGHAKVAFLARVFADIYDGQNYLYFDDTNPDKVSQEFVDAQKYDLEWLGIKFDKEYYASDNIEKMYEYAAILIKNNMAYACFCDDETLRRNRFNGKECEHRTTAPEKNLEIFESMLKASYDQGEVVLRFKGTMNSNNTAMRDPTIFRIKKHPHYRKAQMYSLWPTYDFNTPIMDSISGVTDVIRSKEFELRDELYNAILESLNLRVPRIHTQARLNIKGNETHKRVVTELIEKKIIESYDDPRLMTIAGLRSRGIVPDAIREFVLRFGMSKTDSEVDLAILLAENRKIIDSRSKRLFYVQDPLRLTLDPSEKIKATIPLHPTDKGLGFREYLVNGEVHIAANDANDLTAGEIIRLKSLSDVEILKKEKDNIFARRSDKAGTPKKIIQWVPADNYIKCRILIPENILNEDGSINNNSMKISEGYIESYAKRLSPGEIVQLERFGFSILKEKSDTDAVFVFTSR